MVLLQVAVCDMYNKSAVEHCPEGGRCLSFLQQHVRTLEQHASGIAQQLLQEECRLVAGYPDDMHGQESVHHHKAHPGGTLADFHTASIEVGRSACCCPLLCAAVA